MGHDGTSHSDYTPPPPTARQIVEAYHRNIHTTATTYDVWQVGDALLNRIEITEDDIDVIETDLETFEERTERRLNLLEAKVNELEEDLALLIFNMELEGFPIDFEQLLKFRIKYLKNI